MSSEEIKLKRLRATRNAELSVCDWTQGNDSQLSDAEKQEWLTYRQTLRDFPSTANLSEITYNQDLHIIENVEWPEKPE